MGQFLEANYHIHFECVKNVTPEQLRVNQFTPELHISYIQVVIYPVLIRLSVGIYRIFDTKIKIKRLLNQKIL